MDIQETVSWSDFDDELLSFYKAISVDRIQLDIRSGVSTMDPSLDLRDGRDRTALFEMAREKVEAHGLKLNAVFVPCWDEITLAKADMDEKIGTWCGLLEGLGKAGIPHLGWNFKPMGNFRTTSARGRGGASYSTFDYAEFDRNRPKAHTPRVDEAQMWERMEKFLRAVMPAAAKAGVCMALHPDDPPLPKPLAGVAQICSTLDQFRRIFALGPSRHHAMLFCQGCVAEMGVDVYAAIAEMAAAERIAWVHFRNIRGALPRFEEVFIDEGEVDMRRALAVYRDHGFCGPFMMDHTPHLPQRQAGWAGKAYAIGYIRALIQTVYGA